MLGKLPKREREPVPQAYRQALDQAINERDGKQRLQDLAGQLDADGYTAAARFFNLVRCLTICARRATC